MAHFFSNYDAWKLATPPEYEEEGCDVCQGKGVYWNDLLGEERPCPNCAEEPSEPEYEHEDKLNDR